MIESGARAISGNDNSLTADEDYDRYDERHVPVDVDEEPVTTAPEETPVTSPDRYAVA